MKTVGDILDLVAKNKQSTSPSLRNHALSILDARETGSTTKIGLGDVPRDTPIREFESRHVRKGCDCYCFKYDMGGRIGFLPFSVAYAMGGVGVRNGKHGLELFMSGSPDDVEDCKPNEIYIIVGTHKCEDGHDETAVFTWHPGEPQPSLEDGIWEDTAVKIDF